MAVRTTRIRPSPLPARTPLGFLAIAVLVACAGTESIETGTSTVEDVDGLAGAQEVIERELARIDAATADIDSIFQPLPF